MEEITQLLLSQQAVLIYEIILFAVFTVTIVLLDRKSVV